MTTDQLAAIDRHLRKENWLLNEDLIVELTDHYANGIEERMANDIPFDLAISDIRNGFGGRKGLLKMEEDHQVAQKAGSLRLLRSILMSYFKLPRLPVTVLFTLFVYYVNSTFPLSLKSDYIGAGLFSTAILSYIFAFRRLMSWNKSGFSRSDSINLLLQGFNVVFLLSFYVRLFLPDSVLLQLHPAATTLICVVFFLYEISTLELLMQYNTKRLKSVQS